MNWAQDLRFALRMIRKNPWFSAAIVVTLALGIGVNTTVFTLVNAVLQKPLPFPGGERLVLVHAHERGRGDNLRPFAYGDFRDLAGANQSFDHLHAVQTTRMTVAEEGNPAEQVRGARITVGLFEMLQVRPVLGRGLEEGDGKAGAEPVVVLSHKVWNARYGRNPQVVGRVVRLNGKPATIVGVMGEGFHFPNNEELWTALAPVADDEQRERRALMVVGMLRPGKTMADGQAELGGIAAGWEKTYPKTHANHGVRVLTFHESMNGGPIRLIFLLMLGAVGLVLLIACANVANMLLSKAVARTREISIRAALGASRWRIVRQLLLESVVLSVVGGVLGLGLTQWGIGAFGTAVENVGKPYWIDFSMDYVVFGYFSAVSVLAGLVFGLAPALQAARVDLHDTLKEGARTVGTMRGGLLSSGLVVVQFTLAVVLLTGAGLLVRSFLAAQNEFAAIPQERILTARVFLPQDRYPAAESRLQFYEKLMPGLRATAGVERVALVSEPPGVGYDAVRVEVEGQAVEAAQRPGAAAVYATPGYFDLLGVRMLRGREFEERDGMKGQEVVIVSRQFAARFWPNEEAVGRRVRSYTREGVASEWYRVVGVVPDVRQAGTSPGSNGNDPVLFLPYRQDAGQFMFLLARTGNPDALARQVREQVQGIDADLPLGNVMTLAELYAQGRWHLRVFGTIFTIFAVIALGMASLGIYAVMAHATERRTQEIGVRLALGADGGHIVGMVMKRGLKQLGLSAVLGLGAALGVSRLMSGILHGVGAQDPVTFGVVMVSLVGAGAMACYLPARRAARLDPLVALRHE